MRDEFERLMRQLGQRDAYSLLGLGPSATSSEIKRRAKLLMRHLHPDGRTSSAHSDGLNDALDELFLDYTAARDLLLDHRADYDKQRHQPAGGPPRDASASTGGEPNETGPEYRDSEGPTASPPCGGPYGGGPYGGGPYGGGPYGGGPYGGGPYGSPGGGYGRPWYDDPDAAAGRSRPRASPGRPSHEHQPLSGTAVLALVCAFLCWPVGLVLGVHARRRCRREGLGGRGAATAAILVSLGWAAITMVTVLGLTERSPDSAAALSAAQVEAQVITQGAGRITSPRCSPLPLELDARTTCSAEIDGEAKTVAVAVLQLRGPSMPVLSVTGS